jgi:transmembrane sensor
MSETQMSAQTAAAEDIRARAADWLARRDRGDWSAADQAALDAWLAESWAHTVAYWRLDAAWNRADRLGALRGQKHDHAAAPARASIWPLLFRTAAALVIVGALGVAAVQFFVPHPNDRTYSTGIGGRESIAFADGSRIELNTDTVLRARMTTAQRTIWLDKGEAYFEVKHDPKHPFVVFAGGRRITDLGTNFLIRRDTGTMEVALLQGRLRLGTAGSSRLLMPGDVAVATAESMVVTKKTAHELTDELGWRNGVLVFDNAPLVEVASELNRYNRQKLVIADAATGQLAVVGTFRTNDVQGFTDIVRAVFKLHVRNEGKEIVISR